jgi:LuxR family maltose regulon positive regulatory protein
LAQGEIAAAQRWAEATSLAGDTVLGCIQRHTVVRLRLAQHQNNPQPHLLEESKQNLAQVLLVAEAHGWLGYIIENWLLQARLYHLQRERAAAQSALIHALTLGQSEGYIRTFVDEGEPMRLLLLDIKLGLALKSVDRGQEGLSAYIDRLLAALGPVQPAKDTLSTQTRAASQSLVEPLTEREIEILRLVESGLSNNEIADKLIVTVGTIKKHLNNIFGKLGVSSRTQALANARAVDLL